MSKNNKHKGHKRLKIRQFIERTAKRWGVLKEFLEGKNTLAGRVFAMASKTPIWLTGGTLVLSSFLFFTVPALWVLLAGPLFIFWLTATVLLSATTVGALPRMIREAKERFENEERAFSDELQQFNEERVKRGLPTWDGRGPILDNVSMSDLSSGGFVGAGSKAQAVKLEPLAVPVRRYDLSAFSGKRYVRYGNLDIRVI